MSSLHYRADIDGLRAIAVLLVLVFHFDLVSGGKAGFIGVDVFFVISGFLITSIIKKQLGEKTFSIKTFYLNRIRRLAPALFAVLFLVVIAGSLWLFPKDFIELSMQVLFSQIYIVNFYYWQKINYFGLTANDVFLLHMWSLAVEEQFYLIYPAVILLVHRYLPKYFWLALATGFGLSFILNIAFVDQKPEATFYLLPTRAWELLAGGLVPFLNMKWVRSRALDEVLGLGGLGLIFAAVTLFKAEFRFPGFFALLPVLGAVALILSGASGTSATSRLLSLPPVVYIGEISYPLYLVHWPINVFAATLLNENYVLSWRFAMFVLSIVLAAIIYHVVENPTRRRIIFATDLRMAKGYLAGLFATILIFLLVQVSGGAPKRFPDEVVRLASFVNDRTSALRECEFEGKPLLRKTDFCRIGALEKEPKWLVYGDSHAWAAHSAFDKWLKLNDKAGIFMFRNSCPPVNGIHLFHDMGKCFAFNQAIFNFLDKNNDIGNVVVVSTWRQAIEAKLSTSPDIELNKEESIDLFERKFSETIEHLNAMGKRVYVWEPVPGARGNVPVTLARSALGGPPANIEFALDEYISTYEYFFDALKKNRQSIALTFSPSKALCKNGTCAATVNGNPVYFDNAHVTKSSADYWVEMMQRAEEEENIRGKLSKLQ